MNIEKVVNFRKEAEKILRQGSTIERKLNALESLHKAVRNYEVRKRLEETPKDSAFDRALGRWKEKS